MLRKIRIALASIFFAGITLLFLDVTGALHHWLGWMAKIQFLPAVLALNAVTVAVLILLTLVFGRVYCSVICPLGVMQDIVSWSRGKLKKKNRFRFVYKKENKWLRYGMLAVFIVALVAGIHAIVGLLAPYSTYGRITENLFSPIYGLLNNILAWFSEKADSYTFYTTDVWIKSVPTFIVAAVMFLIICILAWKGGRTWCNNICPVGTVLGFFSRFSLFAPVIDSSKCRSCGLCGKQCKASCIDMGNHKIDTSRCVSCMDCLEACREGAIRYRFRYATSHKSEGSPDIAAKADKNIKKEDTAGRRAFLVSAALLGASAMKAQEKNAKERLAPERVHNAPERENRIVPAGAASLKHFSTHCTACQLCVSACPNNVLRPSSDLQNFMQPEMSYEKGYCRPECTKCSLVCPTGAIKSVTTEEKTSIQIGHAVINPNICVVRTDGVKCGNCAKHCPSGAIRMVLSDPSDPKSLRVPSVDESRCIGCGACENLCPAKDSAAIHIEGHQVHRIL